MASPPATAAGSMKSNISMRRKPESTATATTSRLVEVPIVVLIPPTMVEKPIGIRTAEAETELRSETLIRIGISSTTMGTLLMNALVAAATSRVSSRERPGLRIHRRARVWPTGSSAPVRTRPWPAIISAHTAISASCPKPVKNSAEWSGRGRHRGTARTRGQTTRTNRQEDSSGILSREKSTSETGSAPGRRRRGRWAARGRASMGCAGSCAGQLRATPDASGVGNPLRRWRSRCGKGTVMPCSRKAASMAKFRSLRSRRGFCARSGTRRPARATGRSRRRRRSRRGERGSRAPPGGRPPPPGATGARARGRCRTRPRPGDGGGPWGRRGSS